MGLISTLIYTSESILYSIIRLIKVMQVALKRYLPDERYPYGLITGRKFATSRAVLDAKARQLRMND